MTPPPAKSQDINLKPLVIFVLSLLGVIFLVLIVSKIFMKFTLNRLGREPHAMIEKKHELPSGPRLQTEPHQDLVSFLEKEHLVLTTYGWVDHSKGIVRIPIDRAMDLVLKDGFPTRGESNGK